MTRRNAFGFGAFLITGTLLVLVPVGARPATAAPIHSQVDLGTLGGTNSYSVALNDSGTVTGYSNPTGSTDLHAFRWDATNGMTDIGTLGGSYSIPVAINNAGTVVGRSPIGTGESHAFVWDSVNGITDLGSLGGTNVTGAYAINDSGTVVGESTYSGSLTHAFTWDPDNGMVDIGTLGGTTSAALDVNEAGDVVGWSKTAGDVATRPFIWNSVDGMVDIGAATGTSGIATTVNDVGRVAGISGGAAFRWSNDEGLIHLGTTSGYVYDVSGISNDGDVAGFGFTQFTQARGFVANVDDGFTEIDAGASFVVAAGINSWGSVAGTTWGNSVDTPFVFDLERGTRVLPTGSFGAGAVDINESGQVAGSAFIGGFLNSHAVMWISATGPTVSIATASVVEGDGGTSRAVNFSVTLSDPSIGQVSVPYTITSSANQLSADAGNEFRAKSGTITFKPTGSGFTATTKLVSTVAYPDSASEGDEHYVVLLGTPTGGYALGASVVTAHILDDDPVASTPAVSVGDASITEGDTGTKNTAKLWVTLNSPAATTTTIKVTVGGGTATAPTDYKAFAKTLTFAPGQYKKYVSIIVYPDITSEADETATVTLSNPTGGLALGRASGTLTILTED